MSLQAISATAAARVKDRPNPLLEVKDLSVSFVQYSGGLKKRVLTVITGLSLTVRPGKILAVVGSSGSGKSLLAHAILGILPENARTSGTMLYADEELTPELQALLRGREIALVPQSVNFLDPLMRVGPQICATDRGRGAPDALRRIFNRYHLEKRVERLFPFQLSGGMARRVLVATATIGNARLVIADEPTPGLHPSVVKETLGHLRELADEGRAVMIITHDIEAALAVADHIAVFYAGTTVEIAPVTDFRENGELLRHPYSRALWRALANNGFVAAPGAQPPPDDLPQGCLFGPNCPYSTADCSVSRPGGRELRGGMVRCFHAS